MKRHLAHRPLFTLSIVACALLTAGCGGGGGGDDLPGALAAPSAPNVSLLSTTPIVRTDTVPGASTAEESAAMYSPALPDSDQAQPGHLAASLAPVEAPSQASAAVAATAQPLAQSVAAPVAVPVVSAPVAILALATSPAPTANAASTNADSATKVAQTTANQTDSPQRAVSAAASDQLPEVWQSNFANGLADWAKWSVGWGESNRSFSASAGIAGYALNVFMPKGSIDPATMKNRGLPFGGTGFKSTISASGFEIARLSYKVRFPANFEQGRGGKMPGLCGGRCNGGGLIPDGSDGFSARYMWTGNFTASVYAYLPTSVTYGTLVGNRQIPLAKDRWIQLVQELKLNTPGMADGHIKVWADGVMVVDQQGLSFRTTANLKINGIYFDVFYGGNDDSWAAPQDTSIQFAEFSVSGR